MAALLSMANKVNDEVNGGDELDKMMKNGKPPGAGGSEPPEGLAEVANAANIASGVLGPLSPDLLKEAKENPTGAVLSAATGGLLGENGETTPIDTGEKQEVMDERKKITCKQIREMFQSQKQLFLEEIYKIMDEEAEKPAFNDKLYKVTRDQINSIHFGDIMNGISHQELGDAILDLTEKVSEVETGIILTRLLNSKGLLRRAAKKAMEGGSRLKHRKRGTKRPRIVRKRRITQKG